ncbi:hypothetical protein HAX54_020300 [Datura stramonium]|uniref:NADH-quinone oxidoreductase subunit D domain-containing protein n=1 Tax=Datura stramonium TaxID=4076 RepID=A0ABS8S4V0_DATST|nr:hypothetical protein [Datura stramonium]
MLELSRIASSFVMARSFMADIGAQTSFYIFRERELIYDLFEAATGVAEYQKLLTRNPIFLERVESIGIIGGDEALNWDLSGPMLRASGIEWDLRKVDHYESYDEFDWKALEGIPGGPYKNLEIQRFDRLKDPEWNNFEYRFIRITIGVLVIVWLEREISAGIQQRIGPEYAGPLGILQALADGTKLLLKENLIPSTGDTRLFSIRPSIAVISIFLSYSVIPFGDHLVLANLSIGVFLWIAILSIAPVGLLISGYASNNKYSFLGGLRAAAQSISYEIPLALGVLSISLRVIQ